MKVTVSARVKTRIVNAATGEIVKETPFASNLVLDAGLNALARSATAGMSCTPATAGLNCLIGDGTDPNYIASGGITFTQTALAIVASGNFFTNAMVGGILKYSDGTQIYIQSVTNGTNAVAASAATIVALTGTVNQVQAIGLANFLYRSSNYQTGAGDCGTTPGASGSIYFQRTYIFPQQVSTYNVNEIGWSPRNDNTRCIGRFVLSSTDVVSSANFYIVVIGVTYTYSPGAPTPVANVGTNINTAGNIAIEKFSLQTILTTGLASVTTGLLDGSATNQHFLGFPVAAYTQNAQPGAAGVSTPAAVVINSNGSWTYASVRGKMTISFNGTITTSGQTSTGIGLYQAAGSTTIEADVKFTSGQVLPTGAFQPITVFSLIYDRALQP